MTQEMARVERVFGRRRPDRMTLQGWKSTNAPCLRGLIGSSLPKGRSADTVMRKVLSMSACRTSQVSRTRTWTGGDSAGDVVVGKLTPWRSLKLEPLKSHARATLRVFPRGL